MSDEKVYELALDIERRLALALARLAEAERLMAAAMRNGDFVSDNVLYVYGDDFNAMARFLGRTLREICAGKADSATPASSGDATKAMLAGSASVSISTESDDAP
jgi:hypothetical protein